jgi:hypothetical protein
MHLSEWFWVLMLFWLAVSVWWGWGSPPTDRFRVGGYSLFLFLVILCLGWKVFGSPFQ